MRRNSFLASLLLLIFSLTAFAEPKWIRVPSSDFEIFSTAGEGSTQDVLRHFEEVRGFFEQMSKGKGIRQAEPVRIIVFGSEKEYLPYRPSESAAAYYTQIAGRDYIVLGNVSEDVFPIAVHEYVHLVAQHEGLNLPPWLNEGLADVYSTLKPMGKQILVGSLVKGRVYELLQSSWIPLSTILTVDHNSPYYNEKNKAGSFYAESWALVHMLMLDPAYRPKFSKLMDALQSGGASQQVVESIYGKPLSAFDKEVQAYIRGDRFSGGLVPAKLDSGERIRSEPAQAFDVKLALLDLLEKPGKEADRRKGLADLAAEYPKRPEPHSALGYLAWRTSQQPEAVKEFKIALDLGGRNPQMLWDYGRMAASSDAPDAMRALSLLLSADPGRMDVRLTLAELQTSAQQFKEVLATLSDVKKVTSADAPRLFRAMALAQMNTGALDDAEATAKRWQENAKEDADRTQAQRFVDYLASVRLAKEKSSRPPAPIEAIMTPQESPVAPGPPPPDDSRPVLARRPEPAAGADPAARTDPMAAQRMLRANRPSVAGIFVAFECSSAGGPPSFVLKTPQGNMSFLMDDPKLVFIRGRESDTIDLYCGPQKESAPVWIEYDPPPASGGSARGIARIVHFEPPGAATGR